MKTVYLPHNSLKILKETPDRIIIQKDGSKWADNVYWDDKSAIGFGYYDGKMYVSYCMKYASTAFEKIRENWDIDYDDFLEKADNLNSTHKDILWFNKLLIRPNMSWQEIINLKNQSDRDNFKYAGRIWLDYNVISFWDYPPKNEMNKVVDDLTTEIKKIYGLNIDTHNLMVDAGDGNEKPGEKTRMVPISDYMGNNSNVSINTQHTTSPKDKDINDERRKSYIELKNKKNTKLGNMSQAQYNNLKTFSESKIGFEDDGALGYAHIIDDETINEGVSDKFLHIIDRIKHKFTKTKIKINSIKRSVSDYGQSWYITTKCGKKDWLVRVSDHPVGTNRFVNDPTLAYIYVNYPEEKINKMINMAIYNYKLLRERYDEGKEITDKDFITETTIPNIESPYFAFDGKMYKTTDEGKAKLNSINNAVYNKLKTFFPDANIIKTIENYDYWNPDISYITVLKSDYLELTFSTSFRPLYEGDENKIFNYLDSIQIPENARGQGNAKKAIDAFAELHNEGIIKYLNLKDWSGGFWKHIMERYPFLREKYTHGYITEDIEDFNVLNTKDIRNDGNILDGYNLKELVIQNKNGLLELSVIMSKMIGSGAGSNLLADLCAYADKANKAITANPIPYSQKSLDFEYNSDEYKYYGSKDKGHNYKEITLERLINFYKKFGFEVRPYKTNSSGTKIFMDNVNSKDLMIRYPIGYSINENTQFEVDASDVKLDSFKQQPELHPKFWPNEMLNSKVRLRCLEIADDFIKTLNIPWVEPEDIVLTGSICGFNWSKFSDIDIHIIYDFDKVDEKTNFVREYFNNKKSLWNNEHENLKIYGFPIELYVENIGDNTAYSGIYSLEKNKWIVKPEYNQNNNIKLEKYVIKEKAARLMTKIDDLEEEYESTTHNHQMDILAEKVKNLWDKIKHMRKKALENGDEKNIMSIDNVVFKVMRRTGYLDILCDLKLKTYDKLRSINR